MRLHAEDLRDWMPIRFYRRGDDPFVDWCYMGADRFTAPFFSDTIQRRLSYPFSLLFRHQTPIDVLGELCASTGVVAPTGFIFHMSRCGSTLVSQMLAALPTNIVISEAPPIDSVIDARIDHQRPEWLTWMIGALGRRRNDAERDLFIKFDSWNVLELDFIRSAFPTVPWIFLYRDPVEVIVSHMRQRGSQTVPGAMEKLLPGLSLTDALQMPAEEYCARVLARVCEAALEHAEDEGGLFVNYNQLPSAVTGSIAKHFGLSFSSDEVDTINRAAKFDAKTPQMTFEPDSGRKRAAANEATREAAAVWLDPLYERLENIRARG
jgi:hypothetical protein